jgi:hypothetical protein
MLSISCPRCYYRRKEMTSTTNTEVWLLQARSVGMRGAKWAIIEF